MESEFIVESFDSVPNRGNGGRSSELLDAVRNLAVNKCLVINLDPAKDKSKQVKAISAKLSRTESFTFQPQLRSFVDQNIVKIYRTPGSDYTNVSVPKTKGEGVRFLTESELAESKS